MDYFVESLIIGVDSIVVSILYFAYKGKETSIKNVEVKFYFNIFIF